MITSFIKILEPVIFHCWLMALVIIQFHHQTNLALKKWDYFGLLPSFHLFSPKPFKGSYVIHYKVTHQNHGTPTIYKQSLIYWGRSGLIDANQKIIKCMNNLCKSAIDNPTLSNTNFALLLNAIKNNAKAVIGIKHGEIQFFLLIDYNGEINLKFSSRVYDL